MYKISKRQKLDSDDFRRKFDTDLPFGPSVIEKIRQFSNFNSENLKNDRTSSSRRQLEISSEVVDLDEPSYPNYSRHGTEDVPQASVGRGVLNVGFAETGPRSVNDSKFQISIT
jgi:hypothetical protein